MRILHGDDLAFDSTHDLVRKVCNPRIKPEGKLFGIMLSLAAMLRHSPANRYLAMLGTS
jgi:hypothetical protein